MVLKSLSERDPAPPKVAFRAEETPAVPMLGLIFGALAMVPFVLGAAGVWLLDDAASAWIARLTVVWGGAILSFLAGVRRGLSFRTPGGADMMQMATMLWLFLLALASQCSREPLAACSGTVATLPIRLMPAAAALGGGHCCRNMR